jgi:hypothetical protein
MLHLIIPFASCQADACHQSLQNLRLPHLDQLVRRLTAQAPDAGDAYTRSPPHERALAAACAMAAPDGQIAWGAWQAHALGLGQADDAWALVTPCNWHVAADHIAMRGQDGLALEEAESKALCAAMAPWLTDDGMELLYASPTQWLARGEIFRGLATASLDRVMGRNIDAWMPEGPQAAPLRRLQNEMQMLLYNHPVNDARTARGALPVNSFWLSGTGALPAAGASPAQAPGAEPPDLRWAPALRAPALAEDWSAWADAWVQLDATACAELVQALDAGAPVALTLCGERIAQRLESASRSLWTRISGLFGQKPTPDFLVSL